MLSGTIYFSNALGLFILQLASYERAFASMQNSSNLAGILHDNKVLTLQVQWEYRDQAERKDKMSVRDEKK